MDVQSRVKDILVDQLKVVPEEVQPVSSLRNNLGADSLDSVELIMAFEEEFDIEIPDEDAERLQTVQDIGGYIKNKTKAG